MNAMRQRFVKKPQVINLGLEVFAETLAAHGVPVVQVDWRPPAEGDARLLELLGKLRQGPGRSSAT